MLSLTHNRSIKIDSIANIFILVSVLLLSACSSNSIRNNKIDKPIRISPVSTQSLLFVADQNNNTVTEYKYPYDHALTTTTEFVSQPQSLVIDKNGNLFVGNAGTDIVTEYAPPYINNPITIISHGVSDFPASLVLDDNNNLFVTKEAWNHENILKYTSPYTSTGTTIFRSGVLKQLMVPELNAKNDSLTANTEGGNSIAEYAPFSDDKTTTVYNGIVMPGALAFDTNDNLFVANDKTVTEYAPPYTDKSAVISIGINMPSALAFDVSNNLFVANDKTITVYAPPYTNMPIAVISADIDQPSALAFDRNDNLFVINSKKNITEYAPPYTGRPIAIISDGIDNPTALMLDANENLFVVNKLQSQGDSEVLEYTQPYTRRPKVIARGKDGTILMIGEYDNL